MDTARHGQGAQCHLVEGTKQYSGSTAVKQQDNLFTELQEEEKY